MSKRTGNIGIYTAHGRLTLAMIKGKDFKSVSVDIPENIVSRGEIISKNLYATLCLQRRLTRELFITVSWDRLIL